MTHDFGVGVGLVRGLETLDPAGRARFKKYLGSLGLSVEPVLRLCENGVKMIDSPERLILFPSPKDEPPDFAVTEADIGLCTLGNPALATRIINVLADNVRSDCQVKLEKRGGVDRFFSLRELERLTLLSGGTTKKPIQGFMNTGATTIWVVEQAVELKKRQLATTPNDVLPDTLW